MFSQPSAEYLGLDFDLMEDQVYNMDGKHNFDTKLVSSALTGSLILAFKSMYSTF